MSLMERRSRSYLQLIKPGITLSNTLTAVAGYFLAASTGGFNFKIFCALIFGVAAVVASACVFNNIMDRGRDVQMARTAKRALVSGAMKPFPAFIFATILGLAGFVSLFFWANQLTALLGAIAFFWYIAVYGIAKRTTYFNTLIGGVAGALPPVAGYTAVTNQLDSAAAVLFLLLFIWQIPHFYAIAIFRQSDYKKANFPTWTARFGVQNTQRQIMLFTILFAAITPLLFWLGFVGFSYLLVMAAASFYWLFVGFKNYDHLTAERWARQMFGGSFLALLALCGAVAMGGYLP